MVLFATVFVISTFIIGSVFCSFALWTIQHSPALGESYGQLCMFQMLTDLSLLFVTTVHSLTPIDFAPAENSLVSIIITSIAEISYHYSGAMHDLFAVNRFFYIVFPSMKQAWRKATSKILFVCAIITIFHTVLMMLLDPKLYWVYDREMYTWHMTSTEWTEFYSKYFEVYWSTGEIILIVVLDSITFSFIILEKSMINGYLVQMNHRAETILIAQSFCQCIPTTTVNIIFFFILPNTTSSNLRIMFSSIWIVTNILDAFIIILFHFPRVIAKRRVQTTVTELNRTTNS